MITLIALAIVGGLLDILFLVALGRRVVRWFLLLAFLTLAPVASAQTLDFTTLHGRIYNIATGVWTVASVPGVELCVANVTLSGSWWFDLKHGGYFEQDWSLAWEVLEAKETPRTWRDRLSVSITGAAYVFKDLGTDWVWSVETRYRIFGRN